MQAHHPTSLDEALAHVAAGATPLAGGTDLMVEVNSGQRRPTAVVGLRRIDELGAWEQNRIGAGVTWRQIEREGPTGLAQAARTVGSPQIRNAGTIGGNLATASPAGDGHPFLLAVDASFSLVSSGSSRLVHWSDFFLGVKKTCLADNELVAAVHLPEHLPERQAFGKVGVRNAMVIATVCSVVTRDENGTTTVGLGSVSPIPMRARDAERMISSIPKPNGSDLAEFQRLVANEVRPISDHRSTAEYRRHAAGVLARRLLERCLR